MSKHLKVPGEWLKACGMGEEDKVFPVLSIRKLGEGRTFAKIATGENSTWEVWVEQRGATLLEAV